MVFEKFESWAFATPGPSELFPLAQNFWGQRGYGLQSTGPTSFRGRSFQSRLGIHRVVDVTILPAGSGSALQVRFRADVREDVAVGGVVVAVLLLPVAVVGAALSWHEYELDWSRERWEFWNFLIGIARAQPAPTTPAPSPPSSPLLGPTGVTPSTGPAPPPPPPSPATGSPPPPPVPVSCPTCGAAATGEGRFCASCGSPIARP